jgi:hypothetical protein
MLLERLAKELEKAKVPYAVVGGLALALLGAPRGTVDIDIVVEHSEEIFRRLEQSLERLGLTSRIPVRASEVFNFREEYIRKRNLVAWSFYNPRNPFELVDVIITHDLARMNRVNRNLGATKISVLAREDLIKMKKASARPQDLEDIKVLKMLGEYETKKGKQRQ